MKDDSTETKSNHISIPAGVSTETISIPTHKNEIYAFGSIRNHDNWELVPMVCSQCGGKLNPDTLCCEFCGIYYKLRR